MMANLDDFRHQPLLPRMRQITRRMLRSMSLEHKRYSTLGDWQRATHCRLPEARLMQIFNGMPEWPSEYTVYDYNGNDADEAAQWLRWNEFVGHLTGVLLKVDRASMYNALEVRVPLLDREVIDVAVQVDWRDCFNTATRQGKIPLRESLARHVRFQSPAKKGFEPPMGKWLRTSLRPVMEDTLLKRESLAGVPLNRMALRRLYQEHLNGVRDYGWGLWPLLSLALWETRYGR